MQANNLVLLRKVFGVGGGLGVVSVTFPAAWEALGGLQFKFGKHQFIVGRL